MPYILECMHACMHSYRDTHTCIAYTRYTWDELHTFHAFYITYCTLHTLHTFHTLHTLDTVYWYIDAYIRINLAPFGSKVSTSQCHFPCEPPTCHAMCRAFPVRYYKWSLKWWGFLAGWLSAVLTHYHWRLQKDWPSDRFGWNLRRLWNQRNDKWQPCVWWKTGSFLADALSLKAAGLSDGCNVELLQTAGMESILTASNDGVARIFSLETGQCIELQGHFAQVYTCILSPDQRHIVTASEDGFARIWEFLQGAVVEKHLLKHGSEVYSAVFSHSGNFVVTASQDHSAAIWQVDTGERLWEFLHRGEVYLATFSCDDQLVLTASEDGTARLISSDDGINCHTLDGHSGRAVNRAEFSPDGKLIVTASSDAKGCIWERHSGARTHVLQGCPSDVKHASFSADSRQVFLDSRHRSGWSFLRPNRVLSVVVERSRWARVLGGLMPHRSTGSFGKRRCTCNGLGLEVWTKVVDLGRAHRCCDMDLLESSRRWNFGHSFLGWNRQAMVCWVWWMFGHVWKIMQGQSFTQSLEHCAFEHRWLHVDFVDFCRVEVSAWLAWRSLMIPGYGFRGPRCERRWKAWLWWTMVDHGDLRRAVLWCLKVRADRQAKSADSWKPIPSIADSKKSMASKKMKKNPASNLNSISCCMLSLGHAIPVLNGPQELHWIFIIFHPWVHARNAVFELEVSMQIGRQLGRWDVQSW